VEHRWCERLERSSIERGSMASSSAHRGMVADFARSNVSACRLVLGSGDLRAGRWREVSRRRAAGTFQYPLARNTAVRASNAATIAAATSSWMRSNMTMDVLRAGVQLNRATRVPSGLVRNPSPIKWLRALGGRRATESARRCPEVDRATTKSLSALRHPGLRWRAINLMATGSRGSAGEQLH
jgi:hypothetical protein